MSQCSQAFASVVKRRRNSAAVIDPANPPCDTLLVSATLEFEHLVVGAPERQPPERIVFRLRATGKLGRERLVVGVERHHLGPERDAGGAGQRCHVGDQLRLLLLGERHGVGEDQPAFGVGVADLDRDALARTIDVARTERRSRDRVLHRRNEDAQPQLDAARHQHVGERQHRRRAAHVLLHVQHAGVGLDVEPAGVEADALADQRHLRMRGVAPGEVDQAGRAVRGAADRVDQREVLRAEDPRPRSRSRSRRARSRARAPRIRVPAVPCRSPAC